MSVGVDRGVYDLLPWLRPEGQYRLAVVQCTVCLRCWMRSVHPRIYPGGTETGSWLCPRGWKVMGCPGGTFRVVDLPEVETVWRMTGRHGFGDRDGFFDEATDLAVERLRLRK